MTGGRGQVCKVMLAAQAQTQIQLEHGEVSNELCWKEHFLLLQFLLSSPHSFCAEGDESYFYVHDHLYDQVFLCGCSFLMRD